MNRRSARRFAACLLLALAGLLTTPLPRAAVKAQTNQISAQPVILYRFRVSAQNHGYMLHPFVSAGQNLGYINQGPLYQPPIPGSLQAGIVLPQGPGVTPAAGQHLIPIYQWRVVQSGRTYYYYSGPTFNGGPGYYFEGQLGWVLPASFVNGTVINGRQMQTVPVHYYYSTRYGYWYSTFRPEQSPTIACFPDTCNTAVTSFTYQGVGFKMPVWPPFSSTCIDPTFCGPPTFLFNAPVAPQCDINQEMACIDNGGAWNPTNCTCRFVIDPDPCGGGRICLTTQTAAPQDEPAPAPPQPDPPLEN